MNIELQTKNPKQVFFTMVMWIFGLLMVYPFVSMVVIAFRPAGLAYRPLFYPTVPIADNFITVISHPNFLNWSQNTIVTVVVSIVLRLMVTLPASYAFARLKFRGSKLLLLVFMLTLVVPSETTMVPRYLYYKSLGLFDSLWVVILPELSEVFYLMLLIQFFQAIPRDLNEAACIDGASQLCILARIYVPLSGPAIATAVLFSFINIWNNFLDPYLFITSIDRQMLTPALKYFQERGGANVPVQLAGSAIAIIPIVLLFIFTQKYFVEGITNAGIKG
ncbi:multiple sugar transport system permease protein [Sphaerochaeta associata]|uniref:Carbohydrate ABC transporter permease n=2 Tax=root TaxID=1 RepID=A0ABY4DBR1_9SPIR|nr:carbohydrate ABC transporter permease [Sphaerochaeta associata]UOM51479.1 carbohydrate ABC transporter permease [Sphaerochaeta associata]SMP61641.1 multiple sugar transport system permease protein [Sphaerochaeta associata]